jgi:cytochrome c biogenesis factor
VIADSVNPKTGVVYVKVLVKPLVNFIWIAGFVFVLGSLVALWPDAREQRRLITRLAPARA